MRRFRVIGTHLSETDRHVLKLLGDTKPGFVLQLPDGNMADTAVGLADRGYAENYYGCFFSITEAGRSQLRSNLSP